MWAVRADGTARFVCPSPSTTDPWDDGVGDAAATREVIAWDLMAGPLPITDDVSFGATSIGNVPDDVLWATSGAMSLTGSPDGPPRFGPTGIASGMALLAARLAELSCARGRTVAIDGPALLGERAAIAGFGRQGSLTVGGAGRMVRTADGWLALQLPRASDWDLLAALVGSDRAIESWDDLARAISALPLAELIETGREIGMAIAGCLPAVADVSAAPAAANHDAAPSTAVPELSALPSLVGLKVLDLSALWAGPLCANLLGLAGAAVTKVEDPSRPDGARRGPRRFYDLLHRGHESVLIDFSSATGRDELRRRMMESDVVIEASRPRAMEQLDIDPFDFVGGSNIWLSITARGRTGAARNTIAFGDDAAVEAGAWLAAAAPGAGFGETSDAPHFVADALADPVAGLTSAVAVLESQSRGGGELLDVSLVGAVRSLLRPRPTESVCRAEQRADGQWWAIAGDMSAPVAPPRARRQ
jgi:crotonobetainyl-CoA:carnitine CoA-transferase CaiB-like acyl-CoA transferase